ETARDTSHRRLDVQGAGKLSDAAVGEEGPEDRVLPKRSGPRHAIRSDCRLTRIHDETLEHLIKQRCVATGARDVEGVKDSVFEDVDVVQRDSTKKLRALAADVAGFESQVGSER